MSGMLELYYDVRHVGAVLRCQTCWSCTTMSGMLELYYDVGAVHAAQLKNLFVSLSALFDFSCMVEIEVDNVYN